VATSSIPTSLQHDIPHPIFSPGDFLVNLDQSATSLQPVCAKVRNQLRYRKYVLIPLCKSSS